MTGLDSGEEGKREDSMGNSVSKTGIRAGLFSIVVLIAAVIAIFVLIKPALKRDVPGTRLLSPPAKVPPFSLADQSGRNFNNDSFTGHWTLAAIGYTYCPDVCPTTLQEMSVFFKKFAQQSSGVKPPLFVFFSVDPFRDTPEELGKYVGYFNTDFLGVTGKPEEINKLVAGLKLFYIYEDPQGVFIRDVLHKPAMENYAVVHYAGLLFISPRGELVATMMPPIHAADVLEVFEKLHAYYGD